MSKIERIKIPEKAKLTIENFVLKEELLKLKVKELQKELNILKMTKKSYLHDLRSELRLPNFFEIDLATGTAFYNKNDVETEGKREISEVNQSSKPS